MFDNNLYSNSSQALLRVTNHIILVLTFVISVAITIWNFFLIVHSEPERKYYMLVELAKFNNILK